MAITQCRSHPIASLVSAMIDRATTIPHAADDGRRSRSRLARTLFALVLVTSAVTAGVAAPPSGTAEAGLAFDRWTSGPLGPVSVIGDSVLLGSGATNPTLPDQLIAQGWGPIRFQSIEGLSSGHFNVPWGAKATSWIELWRSQGWDAPTVVVNIGANDSGLCQGSVQCARSSIMHVVNTIGPGHQIWWPMATGEPQHAWRVNIWNTTLAQVASEIGHLHTWDWPTVMATEGYRSHDNVHLDPAGYRRRSARMATQITVDVARAKRTGGDAPLPAPTAAASTYDPLPPTRVIDTRQDPPGRRGARTTTRIGFDGLLPPGATAVAVNVTAAEPGADGYLTAFPCGTARTGSTVNYTKWLSRGAMTITPLDANDEICVYAHTATDIVVDLQGAFVEPGGTVVGSGFQPIASPTRLVDTRKTGRRSVLSVPTPAGADAVAVNITTVNSTRSGWVRAYPCDDDSTGVSNVNYGAGEIVAGGAFVPTSAQNTICLVSRNPVDIVVDLTGTFTEGSGLSFVPTAPTRMIDTRNGTGGWSPIHGALQALDIRVAPTNARAVTGTIAMIKPFVGGFMTTYGCGPRPGTSSVNSAPGLVLANSVTTGISSTGRLCIYSSRTTHVIFDTTGWWVP